MSEPVAYLNGKFIPTSEARLSVADMGVVLGASVSENLRTFHGRLYRLDLHLRRLFETLWLTGIRPPIPQEEFARVAAELIRRNATLLPQGAELGLVIFVTPGAYPTYRETMGEAASEAPTVCMHTFRLPLELWTDKMRHGARLIVPVIRHPPRECSDPSIKSRSRMHFYLAQQEVRRLDPGAEPLLLDVRGFVTETPTANFLMMREGKLVSPNVAGIFPGMSRRIVIELAAKLGIAFIERDISVDEAESADEAFLTSTPYCLLPVTHINRRAIGRGEPGPVFGRLLSAWSKEVGLDIREQIAGVRPRL
jgi:branched-subunit amino acid aminotransferase/4-amino-4-deoxychorismate lyase